MDLSRRGRISKDIVSNGLRAMDMLSALFRLSLSLAATRLVAISMPVVDVIMLAHLSPNSLSAYTLGAQWAQIGVVACGGIGIGIAVSLPRCTPRRRATWLPAILSTSLCWGVVATGLVTILAIVPTPLDNSGYVTGTLALGMVPLSMYASLASYLQSIGQTRSVFWLTAAAGTLNIFLDLVFIHATNPAVGVAWATVTCWTVLCAAMWVQTHAPMLNTARIFPRSPTRSVRRPWKTIRYLKPARLLRIALPDTFSKLGFVGAMALGVWWFGLSTPEHDFKTLAAILNYMNLVFVMLAATTSAFGITFLDRGAQHDLRKFATFTAGALLAWLAIALIFSPITAYIYLVHIDSANLRVISLASLAVLFDGVSLFAITWLRMHGAVSLPPNLRLLMFPGAAIYVSLASAPSTNVAIQAMLFGNIVVAVCLCVMCRLHSSSSTPS